MTDLQTGYCTEAEEQGCPFVPGSRPSGEVVPLYDGGVWVKPVRFDAGEN